MSHGKKPAPKVKKVIRKPKSQLQPQFKPQVRKSQDKPAVVQNPEQFICKSCNEEFGTGQALGGHMSRVHPGESKSYQKKLQRRDERHFDRALLRYAKQMHEERFGPNAALDRVKIRRYKKQIRSAI